MRTLLNRRVVPIRPLSSEGLEQLLQHHQAGLRKSYWKQFLICWLLTGLAFVAIGLLARYLL